MELIILGSGTCAPTLRRSTASYYLQVERSHLLLDIGFGSIRRMMEAGIDYREIDYVLCSHTHPDHVADLGPLLMALRHTPNFQRQKPLTIIGPPGIRRHIDLLAQAYGSWLIEAKGYDLHIEELQNDTRAFDGWWLTAFSMDHSEYTNGYRIEHQGKVLAYSADTGVCDEVVQLLHQADLALLECSFPDEESMDRHLTPTTAGRVAEKAQCTRLLLTHFYPMMDDLDVVGICRQYYQGFVELAEDLRRYVL